MPVSQFAPRPTSVAAVPSMAQRVAALHAEARATALDHVAQFQQALETATVLAREIEAGGETYSVGAREIARRLAPDLAGARLNLESLGQRA